MSVDTQTTTTQKGRTCPIHNPWLRLALVAVLALLVGFGAGFLVFRGLPGQVAGKTVLSEQELTAEVASYTYKGATHKVTAKEVLENSGTLESAKTEDGNYTIPAPTVVVSYIQNKIMLSVAAERGVTVSDDELNEFASKTFGTSDFAALASSYQVSEDTVKSALRDSAVMNKFRDMIVGEQLPAMPSAPNAPETGKEEEPDTQYAEYIATLAGDEWDAEKHTWKRTDGEYYKALSTYEITDKATYAAAQVAYNLASSKYSETYTSISKKWTTTTREIFSQSSVYLATLVS